MQLHLLLLTLASLAAASPDLTDRRFIELVTSLDLDYDEDMDAIKESVSGTVETLIVPNCGHSPHVEARTVVVDHVSEFLLTNLRH